MITEDFSTYNTNFDPYKDLLYSLLEDLNDSTKRHKLFFTPKPEFIHISHFGCFMDTYAHLAENFIYISSPGYNSISESLKSYKYKLNPGHPSSRHVIAPIEYRLSIALFLMGVKPHEVSLSYAHAPRFNPLGTSSLNNSVMNFKYPKRSYSTSVIGTNIYKGVTSLVDKLGTFRALLERIDRL
ncbi:hypothetical protein HK096_000001 [Nowakowskiella sp. JEL0078]|nr:hypothetical protein HK096_000001 [Nowakowskiella sp. JEL0078]